MSQFSIKFILVTGCSVLLSFIYPGTFIQTSVARLVRHVILSNSYCSQSSDEMKKQFDRSLLDILVCPLCKGPLRYDEKTNELVSDKIGVAYPIVNGIPNLVPQDARMLNDSKDP